MRRRLRELRDRFFDRLLGDREAQPSRSEFGPGASRRLADKQKRDDYDMAIEIEKMRTRRGMGH